MSFRLLPKDPKFFELFIADGDNLAAAGRGAQRDGRAVRPARRAGRRHPGPREARRRDRREVTRKLEDAFVTPFDREDIHELVARLDDVVDGIQAIAETFVIYGVTAPTPEARRLAAILDAPGHGARPGTAQARRAQGPRTPFRARSTSSRTRPTACHGRPWPKLFRDDLPPIDVIKWRDLYNDLEEAIDAAEDAAEAMERMYHKAN